LILEVKGGGVVHGQLDTEAASVLDEQEPSVQVEGTCAERSSGRNIGHGSVLLELAVVTLGRVFREKVHANTNRKGDDGRDNRDPSPRNFGRLGLVLEDLLEKREKSRSHDQLGDTSSKVPPPTNKSVGGSDDLLGEHSGSPVLAHDEGTSSGSNEQTEDGKVGSVGHQTSAGGWDGSTAKDGGEKNTWSDLVTEGTEEETHENGSSDTDDRRGPDFLLGQIQSGTDLGKKRGNGEPDEEGNEETQPGEVEGSHVWAREVAKLDLISSVILFGVDLKLVRVVFLPFSLWLATNNEK